MDEPTRPTGLGRRDLMKIGALAGAGVAVRFGGSRLLLPGPAGASVQVPQTALDGSTVTRFVTPLPTFVGRRVTASSVQAVMSEFQQKALPDSFYTSLASPFRQGTFLWGYGISPLGHSGSPQWPGVTVQAQKGTQTTIKYVNSLPANPVLRGYLTIDQTIHWADPLNAGHKVFTPYTGPIPTVVHLHGGEDQSTSDGVPEGWFTNNGLHGPGTSRRRRPHRTPPSTSTRTTSSRRRCGSTTTRSGSPASTSSPAWPRSTSSGTSSTPGSPITRSGCPRATRRSS